MPVPFCSSKFVRRVARISIAIVLAAGTLAGSLAADEARGRKIDFAREVRPILSNKCFHCHGPDESSREGGFRFDLHESATGKADSGSHPIVPGDPSKSEAIRRVTSADESERMPPLDSPKGQLSPEQVETLRLWIQQGAKYEKHWAFVAPVKHAPPAVKLTDWPRGAIDRFLLARMEQARLAPNPPASRASLLRRVTFDLTGLPPTPEEIAAFENDTSPDAYEKVVEGLLAREQFGEAMALTWLDAARYADTNGYLQNGYRASWPWRDWLVDALNKNMPYDRFMTELLAGDLVENASDETKLATCFLRMHMITSEGGSLDEEFRVEYAADRAETVSMVFMGLTVACCRCHDHKYDPFSQQEYFQLFSMFADPKGEDPVKDHSRDVAFVPYLRLPKERFANETARLQECQRDAETWANANYKSRLGLEQKMIDDGVAVMIMEENPAPKQNYVLKKGAYDAPDLSRPVQRGAIDSVHPFDASLQRNRLGLANWLTDAQHPLPARVEVNRLWALFFGRGLVDTPEDFGMQGSFPTHPELLDYLAVHFREIGWDRKQLIREIVLSNAYQQSSVTTAKHRELDPLNRSLARMNRRRLSGEAIRDQALAVAGLLDHKLGGHPALPYQPKDLWREGANNPGYGRGSIILSSVYEPSSGSELYRRSIYTFWNRNAPPPQLMTFDAPGRSYASVSRTKTNTPLQALATMNDPQFIEAARFLAERVLLDEAMKDDAARMANLYQRASGRTLASEDSATLLAALKVWRTSFAAKPEDAQKLLAVGDRARSDKLDAAEHAAWTMAATTILNLDASLVLD